MEGLVILHNLVPLCIWQFAAFLRTAGIRGGDKKPAVTWCTESRGMWHSCWVFWVGVGAIWRVVCDARWRQKWSWKCIGSWLIGCLRPRVWGRVSEAACVRPGVWGIESASRYALGLSPLCLSTCRVYGYRLALSPLCLSTCTFNSSAVRHPWTKACAAVHRAGCYW